MIKTKNDSQLNLVRFFAEKAERLQKTIDLEIEKIGGEDMLISREDLMVWVYFSRKQIEMYRTICRMLEDQANDTNTNNIILELRRTVETDRMDIDRIKQKQEEEKKALEQLREEAKYYQQALEILGALDYGQPILGE